MIKWDFKKKSSLSFLAREACNKKLDFNKKKKWIIKKKKKKNIEICSMRKSKKKREFIIFSRNIDQYIMINDVIKF